MGLSHPFARPGLTLLFSAAAFAACASEPAPTGANSGPHDVATLIARLPEVSEREALAAQDGDPANRFWPTEPETANVSPLLRQLVSRGVEVLPPLIDHLTDARPTHVVMRSGNSLLWFGDMYDPRYSKPNKQPSGVNRETVDTYWARHPPRWPNATLDSYTARVGDLCFVAIGKIVNRALNAAAGTPGNFIVSSPLERPMLVAAVKRDWSGLTREQHSRSLSDDIVDDSTSHRGPDALTRLCFYYPETGERMALKVLARPIDDDVRAYDFVDKLLAVKRPSQWKPMVRRFVARNGEASRIAVIRQLCLFQRLSIRQLAGMTDAERNEFKQRKARATPILKSLYPKVDSYLRPFSLTTFTNDQADYVEAVAAMRSDAIDRAVLKIFRTVPLRRRHTSRERAAVDNLALTCIDRLVGRGFDGEIGAYFEKRIAELKATVDRDGADDQRLEMLTRQLRIFQSRK